MVISFLGTFFSKKGQSFCVVFFKKRQKVGKESLCLKKDSLEFYFKVIFFFFVILF